jgi:PAS domain S-box-containing protein
VEYTFYLLAALIAAMITGGIAAYAWRHRETQGAPALAGAMLAGMGWALGSALALVSSTPEAASFWHKVWFTITPFAPLAWLTFALQYVGRPRWLAPRRLALLASVPFITVAIVWTNEAHGLFWAQLNFYHDGFIMRRELIWGAWFWIYTAYSYALTTTGMLLVIGAALRSFHLYRQQAIALIIGAVAPLAGSIPATFGLTELSFTPIGFAVGGLGLAWGLFRYQLLNLAPVARSALVDSMSDAMLVLDTQNRVVDINPAARRLIGASPNQLIGQPVAQVLSPWRDLVERYQNTQSAQTEITLNPGGTPRYYDLRISPVVNPRGTITGRLIILRDITERTAAEEALRQANIELLARNEELDAFGHTVAHDLKSALSLIYGHAKLLESDHATMTTEQVQRSTQTLGQMALKMDTIIEELMLLTGLRHAQVEMKPLEMNTIVAEAGLRLAGLIEHYHAEIICPPNWPVALGHGPWVEEVWVNYISNAIKYGGAPPRVELGADVWPVPLGESGVGGIRFWVRDNGAGLAPEAQARLFTPFERLDQTRATGHGLGLSIVRRIVEKMGGQVSVESDGIAGRGCTFSFTLSSPADLRLTK